MHDSIMQPTMHLITSLEAPALTKTIKLDIYGPSTSPYHIGVSLAQLEMAGYTDD